MSGPKNTRCRNFNDEGVGVCDSGEYCRFVHPGPRWANARSYHNRDDFEHLPKFWASSGGGGGGGRGRPGGGKGPIPRRCRHSEPDGSQSRGGCFRHAKGECRFTHPDQPGWDTATPSENSFSQAKTSFGLTSGSNSLPAGFGRGGSNSSFGQGSMDVTTETTSGFGFGTNVTQHSPEPITPSSGWGRSNSNEAEQPANEPSGGSGWGWGDANQGWGAGEASTTSSGWGGGGGGGNEGWGSGQGWGSSDNVTSSGGGGWGSSGKNDDTADTTQPTAQTTVTDANPPIPTSSDNAWGSSGAAWGSSNNTSDPSNNAWGTSAGTWDSSGWGSSNNTWTTPNETAQNQPVSNAGPDAANAKGWGNDVQNGGWSDWASNSRTTAGLNSSGGGWGSSTPSIPATVGVTQDHAHATTRLDTSSATMNIDEGSPQFDGKAIFNALENAIRKRRNKRKRSHEDIRLSPRYYRHLFAPRHTAESGVDGDGDAVMGETENRPVSRESAEPGEIVEAVPCINYDMNVLSREPKTYEEKTMFAKHLLYIFTEAAVMVDRSRKAEKRYEDYKKSQEARMYNHPGPKARQTLVDKLQALRMSSHERSERLAGVIADLGSLPSHYVSDVVAYNEHNHLTEEALAEEKRKAAIEKVEKRLNEQHECVDRKLLELQTRLDELAKEKGTREVIRNLPHPVDPNETAMEEVVTVHETNMQRVAAVEVSVQAITSAESIPHRGGPIQALEKSLPTMDGQASQQLHEFAEGIAKLIQQVPVVREEIHAIKASNEERKAAEKGHQQSVETLNQQVAASSAQLETLNARVKELVKGLQLQVTMENIHSAIRPVLEEQTNIVIAEVRESVDSGLTLMRQLILEERTQMRTHIYERLVGTQRLFEAVGCYLRSVRADLASLVDKDRGTTERS